MESGIISLKNRSDLLDALLNAAVEAIVVSDADGMIALFSQGAQELFGYSEAQACGQNVSILMSDHDRHQHDGYMHQYMDTGQERIIGIGREVIGRHQSGEEFPLHLSVGDANNAGQRMFVAIMQDLRPRNRLRNDLDKERQTTLELERTLANVHRASTLGEMSAGIAHEINQPLAAMATFADAGRRLLVSSPPQLEKLDYALEQISQQAGRAGDVVERIRALARREDTPRALHDINGVIRALLALAELEARDRGAEIRLDLADHLPKPKIDPVQIQQVLLNLIRNGLEAMVRPSQISSGLRIESGVVDGEIQVAVVDHGSGVEPAERDKIFEPFQSSKPAGMGIGLSICRTIMRRHGGRLWCEENPLGGSRFVLALPLAEESK
ncbi:MAG: nitrogen regulation protein NR(II) [Lysobacterales bacterium]